MTSRPMVALSLLICLFGQNSHACPSSVMEGIGLGGLVKFKTNATSWQQCCDICSGKSMCVTWTYLSREKICLIRDERGKRMMKHPNQISGMMQSAALPAPNRHKQLLIYVGVLSAPNNRAKRDKLRQDCFPRFQRLAVEHRLEYDFVIGRPHDHLPLGHYQGYINRKEADAAENLSKEHDEFGDMNFITSRDTYVDLPTKTLEVVKAGVLRGAKYIVKMDDDMCLSIGHFTKIVKQAKEPKYAYIANMIWDRKYYESQNGADGKFVKYMSGPIYALSFSLARLITFADMNYASMYPMYGSSSEDVDMGRWVKYAAGKHNVTVSYLTGHIGDAANKLVASHKS